MSSTLRRALVALTLVSVAVSGCIFSPDEEPPSVQPLPTLLPPTRPENLIANLETIYNDKVRNFSERHAAYRDLFPPNGHATVPAFLFRFQPDDVEPGEDPSWGLDSELEAHRNMFRAQDNREIFSLTLDIQHLPPTLIEFEEGKEGWMRIFATNVDLRLMFNPEDGLEVNGGQANFDCAPADGRWYIGEWEDIEI